MCTHILHLCLTSALQVFRISALDKSQVMLVLLCKVKYCMLNTVGFFLYEILMQLMPWCKSKSASHIRSINNTGVDF